MKYKTPKDILNYILEKYDSNFFNIEHSSDYTCYIQVKINIDQDYTFYINIEVEPLTKDEYIKVSRVSGFNVGTVTLREYFIPINVVTDEEVEDILVPYKDEYFCEKLKRYEKIKTIKDIIDDN